MKIPVTFKTLDVLEQIPDIFDEEEFKKIKKFIDKYVKWDEYITLEFDISNETVEVLEV